MTITEFLAARLDEEERVASEADEYSLRVNGPDRPDAGMRLDMDHPALIVDERRVLREIAAKRQIVAYEDNGHLAMLSIDAWGSWHDMLKFLAMPYAGHPDYDPAWVLSP